jgi:uncharacterized RDD family membrane protein YckC
MTNPYAPPQAVVQDILDPAAGILLADRGVRLGASILDGLVFGVMVYLPLMAGAFVGGIAQAQDAGDLGDGSAALGLGMSLAAAGFVAWLWITIKYLKANGQSIGKKACGIKVVRRDGSPVSVSRVIWLRNVVNMIIGVIPLYGFIDALFIFGEARRCVHDHLADTIVIKA